MTPAQAWAAAAQPRRPDQPTPPGRRHPAPLHGRQQRRHQRRPPPHQRRPRLRRHHRHRHPRRRPHHRLRPRRQPSRPRPPRPRQEMAPLRADRQLHHDRSVIFTECSRVLTHVPGHPLDRCPGTGQQEYAAMLTGHADLGSEVSGGRRARRAGPARPRCRHRGRRRRTRPTSTARPVSRPGRGPAGGRSSPVTISSSRSFGEIAISTPVSGSDQLAVQVLGGLPGVLAELSNVDTEGQTGGGVGQP